MLERIMSLHSYEAVQYGAESSLCGFYKKNCVSTYLFNNCISSHLCAEDLSSGNIHYQNEQGVNSKI